MPLALQAGSSSASGRSRLRRLLRYGVLALALVVCAAGLVTWWQAAHDEGIARAERRDTVLIAAQQHIETMNTLDHRKVDEGLAAWSAVTTGTLHDQLTAVGEEERQLLADQKKISTGEVIDAAVVDLDGSTATVIASVEVTVRDGEDPNAEPTVKRNRFTADLLKVGGTWKLESLQQVAVDLS